MHTNEGDGKALLAASSHGKAGHPKEGGATGCRVKRGNTEVSDLGSLFNQGEAGGANGGSGIGFNEGEKKQEFMQRSAEPCKDAWNS